MLRRPYDEVADMLRGCYDRGCYEETAAMEFSLITCSERSGREMLAVVTPHNVSAFEVDCYFSPGSGAK